MYDEFFGLSCMPFGTSADLKFLYLTPQHREAATGLICTILNREGCALLTGEPGTGKTMVLKATLSSFPVESVLVCDLLSPTLSQTELLEYVMLRLGVDAAGTANKAQQLLSLERFLIDARYQCRTVVMVVDEAQSLPVEVLEEIRLLMNLEDREGKLLQIVLAGQPELDTLLRQKHSRQFKQRVAYRFSLRPLSMLDVESYIDHRWQRAGGTTRPPFEREAIRSIAAYSRGIPRLINIICNNALLAAFACGSTLIRASHVVGAAQDLDLVERGEAATPRAAGTEDEIADLQRLTSGSSSSGRSTARSVAMSAGRGSASPWLVRSAKKLLLLR